MSGKLELRPDSQSDNPTEFWAERVGSATVMRFKTRNPKDPAPAGKARIVCISDTHSMTSHMNRSVPDGDVLIHAGDFTRCGHLQEVRQFNTWLGSLPHPHKIVVAGNHEISFDPNFKGHKNLSNVKGAHRSNHTGDGLEVEVLSPASCRRQDSVGSNSAPYIDKHYTYAGEEGEGGGGGAAMDGQEMEPASIKKELTNCIYLEDRSVTLYGIKFYGSPWQPEFHNWGFNLRRGRPLLDKWDMIPDDTDVLITHTPPVGYGDLTASGLRAGCVDLLNSVQRRIRPKYHVYGHIHEGYGVRSDGKTVFVNASICDLAFKPSNKPIAFDVAIPPGFDKTGGGVNTL